MIKSIKEKKQDKIEINLTGENGNAYFLLGMVEKLSKQLERNDWKEIQSEMMSGDYDNLLNVFEREFSEYVIMYR